MSLSAPARQLWTLAAIFVLALGLRVGFVLTRPNVVVWPDAQDHDAIARNILHGNGFVETTGQRASRAAGMAAVVNERIAQPSVGVYGRQCPAELCRCDSGGSHTGLQHGNACRVHVIAAALMRRRALSEKPLDREAL